MLTIGQLASYAGVTRRAVRHYHAKGLLPEPEKDRSGYRRYNAHAVVQLIRIRTLADAGVPLARVRELLTADEEEFAAAVAEIDHRLRAEIRERQRHRERVAQLASGDSLALPPEAVAYLNRMRELGFRERVVEIERDSWILVAAQAPKLVPTMMSLKRHQIEDTVVRELYLAIDEIFDCDPTDPRLPAFADRVVSFIEAAGAKAQQVAAQVPVNDQWLTEEIINLLDSAFLDSFAAAPRMLELLEERGYTGWTNIQRAEIRPH